MSEKILISRRHANSVIDLSNCDNEFIGYFLAERTPYGLQTLESVFVEAGENSTGTVAEPELQLFRDKATEYLRAVQRNSNLALIGSHAHSRKFGDRIRTDDPYWSVDGKKTRYPLDTVVDRMFYISGRGGDDNAFEMDHDRYGVNHHIFVHPAFSSEGEIMTPHKARLTGFKYDQSRLGKVNQIGVELT